jgi:PleD family two-component response regulator
MSDGDFSSPKCALLNIHSFQVHRETEVTIRFSAEEAMPSRKTKLPIVDDEPSTRLLLSQIMAKDYEVAMAEDGAFAPVPLRRSSTSENVSPRRDLHGGKD